MMLAPLRQRRYPAVVVVNPAARIGVLNISGGHTASQRFFCVRSTAAPLWAGRVGVPSGTPASETGTPILHGSALPDWRRGSGKQSALSGVIAMTHSHAPARSPSTSPECLRANWHRRMAMACLRADSSKSVRLARYHAHIEKARILEADLPPRFEAIAYFEAPSNDSSFRLVRVSLGFLPSHAQAQRLCEQQQSHPAFAAFRVVCVAGGEA